MQKSYDNSLCNWKHACLCSSVWYVSALNVTLCIFADAPPHLPFLVERFDGQTIGTDVDDSAQLEPIRRVGRPHRLSIIHFTAEEETQENEWNARGWLGSTILTNQSLKMLAWSIDGDVFICLIYFFIA